MLYARCMTHRLVEKDPVTMTGTCVTCGPVRLRSVANGPDRPRKSQCWNKKAEEKKKASAARPWPSFFFTAAHGLTREEADALKDGRTCAICGTADDLCVDHCHSSLVVRGVLCRTCNAGIGFFYDRPDLLAAAIRYLTG